MNENNEIKLNYIEENILKQATKNCENIIIKNYKVKKNNKTLIIYDNLTKHSNILTSSYEYALINKDLEYKKINFYEINEEEIKENINQLKPNDLVILIQSSSFRMSKYRWRNLLHEQGLKVIEHPQLEKNLDEEINTYINSLNYDLDYYLKIRDFLKPKLKKANSVTIISSDGSKLLFSGKMDEVYDNMAFFEDKKLYGTRFPVGEILTELKCLENLNGEFLLYAFPDKEHKTNIVKPFKCIVKNGKLIKHNGPKKFNEIFEMIKTENPEKEVFIRELGFGMNRGIKKFERLGDISSYERLVGFHLSLGMKHNLYIKKLYPKYGRKFYQRFHIDIFIDLKEILIDNIKVYEEEKGWLIN